MPIFALSFLELCPTVQLLTSRHVKTWRHCFFPLLNHGKFQMNEYSSLTNNVFKYVYKRYSVDIVCHD